MNFGFYNMDCMEGMKQFQDKYFDLAIVDPPYFSGPETKLYYGKSVSTTGVKRNQSSAKHWEKVNQSYWVELNRIAKAYIFWGCNYYKKDNNALKKALRQVRSNAEAEIVLETFFGFDFHSGRIFWDKVNHGSDFSDGEIAATNLFDHVRMFRFMWNGMLQGKSINEGWIQQGNKKLNEKRIHSTQKPVALYHWLLKNYAKPYFKILDTHVGSASSLIACEGLGFDYVGFEIDNDNYAAAKQRLENWRILPLFDREYLEESSQYAFI